MPRLKKPTPIDEVRAALNGIRAHHENLNRRRGRPVEESHTLGLVRRATAALNDLAAGGTTRGLDRAIAAVLVAYHAEDLSIQQATARLRELCYGGTDR